MVSKLMKENNSIARKSDWKAKNSEKKERKYRTSRKKKIEKKRLGDGSRTGAQGVRLKGLQGIFRGGGLRGLSQRRRRRVQENPLGGKT